MCPKQQSIVFQSTSIPTEWVEEAKSTTPPDYPCSSAGLAITIGSIAAKKLQVPPSCYLFLLAGVWREKACPEGLVVIVTTITTSTTTTTICFA